jgi:hypothetical protein
VDGVVQRDESEEQAATIGPTARRRGRGNNGADGGKRSIVERGGGEGV